MTGTMQGFALIGRSFQSDSFGESFEGMRRAAIAARRLRRAGAWDAEIRARPVWRGSGEAIVVAALGR